MTRPNKKQASIFKQRDKKIAKMRENGYPIDFVAEYFNISKGRVSQIYKDYLKLKK